MRSLPLQGKGGQIVRMNEYLQRKTLECFHDVHDTFPVKVDQEYFWQFVYQHIGHLDSSNHNPVITGLQHGGNVTE